MLFLSLTLWAAVAHASPIYPETLGDEVEARCTPLCTACHETLSGGAGTVVQPFGLELIDRGLHGGSDVDLLVSLVAEIAKDEVDVDDDGIPDVDELADGFDPNPGDETFCDVEPPRYGCATVPGSPHLPWGVLALALTRRRGASRHMTCTWR